jgi:hypothetical protein
MRGAGKVREIICMNVEQADHAILKSSSLHTTTPYHNLPPLSILYSSIVLVPYPFFFFLFFFNKLHFYIPQTYLQTTMSS